MFARSALRSLRSGNHFGCFTKQVRFNSGFSMLKQRMEEIVPTVQAEVKEFRKAHGSEVICNVTVEQVSHYIFYLLWFILLYGVFFLLFLKYCKSKC